jgi:Tfp pilus assembly protein PilX
MHPARRARQGGATLIIAMVLLIAMALFGIWSVKSSTTNLHIVGNTQARQEAMAVAQTAMEQTISTPLFTQSPETVAAAPLPTDIDGDGNADYTANVSPAPSCYRTKVIKANDLDPAASADMACMGSGSVQNAGIEVEGGGTINGDSLCSDSEWNVRVVVADPDRTEANVAVNQGIKLRTLSTDANNACP